MFRIVSMYTKNTEYHTEAQRLYKSLAKHRIPHVIYECESTGSWEKNCQLKACAILEALEKNDCAIVWTDADSEIIRYPSLFDELSCDIALHKIGTEYLSGTVYFANNETVKGVVREWVEVNKRNLEWDQKNLQFVLSRNKIDLAFLPSEYCKIFDRRSQQCKEPVIVHYQASRRLKYEV
jgi:hypothetical protein